jgi:prepilin-type N-terminal cleavage/methylation domain-containing protein
MERAARKSGFTLLELMVATAILAVALVATVSVLTNAMLLENQAEEQNTATNAAQLQMQRLRGMDFEVLLAMVNDPPGDGTSVEGAFAVHGLRARGADADGDCGWFEIRKRAGAVNDNVLDITVRIEWESRRNAAMEYQMVSVRSDRGMRWEPPEK